MVGCRLDLEIQATDLRAHAFPRTAQYPGGDRSREIEPGAGRDLLEVRCVTDASYYDDAHHTLVSYTSTQIHTAGEDGILGGRGADVRGGDAVHPAGDPHALPDRPGLRARDARPGGLLREPEVRLRLECVGMCYEALLDNLGHWASARVYYIFL